MKPEPNGKPKLEREATPISLGIMCLVLGIAVLLSCQAPKFINPPEEEPPPLPYGIPCNVTEYRQRLTMSEGESCVVPYGGQVKLTVHFREAGSSWGYWSGSKPTLSIANESYVGKTHTDTWGDRMAEDPRGGEFFTPWLKVSFPIKQEYYHEWVDATATMDISYPATFRGYFINLHNHLRCSFRFFVVSPDEYDSIGDLIKQHQKWQHFQAIRDQKWVRIIPPIVFNGLGVVLICIGLVIRRVRKRQPPEAAHQSVAHSSRDDDT